MKFRTEYIPGRSSLVLSPEMPVVLLGSCFADNMAARMRSCLWNACNLLGTLYNPLSIEKALRALLFSSHPGMEFYESLFQAGGRYHSWLFDSRISAEKRDDCMAAFLERKESLESLLGSAKAMFVTFGTSWCYYLADRKDYVVANCHKQPASLFYRRRVSVEEIVERWVDIAMMLKDRYPHLEIVFTVSPVRHLKDGFSGNSHSKAVLLLATEELCRRLDFCHYFPAYEIVNDDLRDYRFYASDLVHPSEEAVEYIWEIFRSTFVDSAGEMVLKEGEKIFKAWMHRPLPSSTRCPSAESVEKEERRREEIRLRHAAFRAIHPGMLPIDG
ncbi:MAG: GSCFA domain-containing protein [Muribaculaceae bacterium]|nr:GSCFA domain-containing protein [Muribaculaceae bacterium]